MILALKRSASSRDEPTPDITATGAIIDGQPPVWPFSEAVETELDAAAAVRKLAAAGVDQIKVYSLLKREVYFAAVTEAKRLGLTVTGHVPYSVSLSEAAGIGQDAIEHLEGFAPLFNEWAKAAEVAGSPTIKAFSGWQQWAQVDREKLAAAIAEQKNEDVVHIPTLIVMGSIGRITDPNNDPRQDPRMKYVSPAMLGFWQGRQYETFSPRARAAIPAMTELVGELYRGGVTLAVGTDLANPYVFPGSAVHDEMERFVQAGIPAHEVLKMATLIPARLCGVETERGSIAVGKTASLVLLRENPLEDIKAVRQIETVWLRGQRWDRAALDALLKKIADAAAGDSRPADPTTKPELPGELLLSGTYQLKFQQFDAGQETFMVSRADDGYHTWSHSQPKGGGQAPAIVRTHFTLEGQLVSAEYQLLTGKKLRATYRLVDGKLEGTAEVPGKPSETLQQALTEPYRISTPIYAAEFMFYGNLGLKVGESTKIQSVGFGFPDWKPAGVEVEIARVENETLEIDGQNLEVQVFTSKLKSSMGEMNIKSYSDAAGHTVRTELKFPFGAVTAVRKLEQK